jgi:hypothetical protein
VLANSASWLGSSLGSLSTARPGSPGDLCFACLRPAVSGPAWRQSEPCRHVPSTPEGSGIADRGRERRRVDRSDPRDRHLRLRLPVPCREDGSGCLTIGVHLSVGGAAPRPDQSYVCVIALEPRYPPVLSSTPRKGQRSHDRCKRGGPSPPLITTDSSYSTTLAARLLDGGRDQRRRGERAGADATMMEWIVSTQN